jgi:predicted ATPase
VDEGLRHAVPGTGRMVLERDAELRRLHSLLGDLDSQGGRVVLVRGEAGVGKSALISQFIDSVRDETYVLVGICDDLVTPQPLGPVWDVARQDASLIPPLSDGDRREVMETLLSLLSRRLRPTVLVFEDMQWADEATLDITRFLGRRFGDANGLLMLTQPLAPRHCQWSHTVLSTRSRHN